VLRLMYTGCNAVKFRRYPRFRPGDGNKTSLKNFSTYIPNHTASHPKRPPSFILQLMTTRNKLIIFCNSELYGPHLRLEECPPPFGPAPNIKKCIQNVHRKNLMYEKRISEWILKTEDVLARSGFVCLRTRSGSVSIV
jgi:hypothetical protein